MAKYTITLNRDQETALKWCLAEQRAANPDEAPEDIAGLVLALMRDRIGQVVRQHEAATAAGDPELAEALTDRGNVLKARKALGLDK